MFDSFFEDILFEVIKLLYQLADLLFYLLSSHIYLLAFMDQQLVQLFTVQLLEVVFQLLYFLLLISESLEEKFHLLAFILLFLRCYLLLNLTRFFIFLHLFLKLFQLAMNILPLLLKLTFFLSKPQLVKSWLNRYTCLS